MPSERNPLRSNPGKGDVPRSCHSKKYKENIDQVDWNVSTSKRPWIQKGIGRTKKVYK